MTSIRRRTATLVALSVVVLLVLGGVSLVVVLRQAMTAQFDDGLAARSEALQSLTRFNGTKVEMDFAGEAMPHYDPRAVAEVFVSWTLNQDGWRVLERSDSLGGGKWPAAALRDGPPGVFDTALPGGGAGRAMLIEFAAPRERDDEAAHQGGVQPGGAAVGAPAGESPAPRVRLLVALSRSPLDREFTTVVWCIAGVGGALVLVSIAASSWAVSRGLVPLHELSQRVRSLGPETLGTRLDAVELPVELRPIAEQLSALLARLHEAFEREKRFSAAVSHELRTPVAELRMLLEVAASQTRTSDEWSRTADTALGVLARAQSLCETLLRLSRAGEGQAGTQDGGDARCEIGPVLAAQAARAVSMHGGGGDGHKLSVECEAGVFARADASTVNSIVGNLLDNAFRHGAVAPDSPIVVRVSGDLENIRIVFVNSAPGVTDDDMARLFEPFWRKDASRSDGRSFGLGLAVARSLARASGGDIQVTREKPGTLAFVVLLPVAG